MELESLRFSVAALADITGDPGSYKHENAQNISTGIRHRLTWCIDQIDKNELIGARPKKLSAD